MASGYITKTPSKGVWIRAKNANLIRLAIAEGLKKLNCAF